MDETTYAALLLTCPSELLGGFFYILQFGRMLILVTVGYVLMVP
jgi:hypothetical protein